MQVGSDHRAVAIERPVSRVFGRALASEPEERARALVIARAPQMDLVALEGVARHAPAEETPGREGGTRSHGDLVPGEGGANGEKREPGPAPAAFHSMWITDLAPQHLHAS